MQSLKRHMGKEPFRRVSRYTNVAFGGHQDGKSKSGCVIVLWKTPFVEICQHQKMVSKPCTKYMKVYQEAVKIGTSYK
jgi:hypothetical protein